MSKTQPIHTWSIQKEDRERSLHNAMKNKDFIYKIDFIYSMRWQTKEFLPAG
ncbi:hypothetical protein NQF87_01695 [Bombella sp. TMW 2.2559]|uniref:Uncharacterized protein n=1 Tax=Bombella dulcis TaxID=2967339 RepID=A0ABT3W9D0_9PROT|nr:hypothetical protein [Bombella dulcis]MCX5615695.1 hypothetical protein [Bombella dulcis]